MKKPIANNRIRAKKVRVIDPEGNNLGVMSLKKALQEAKERGLDLIQVTRKVRPPVCKIRELDKYRYELEKKQKSQQKETKLKIVKIRYNTSPHDLKTKQKQAKEFLDEGHQVQVSMQLRGREKAFGDLAEKKMKSFLKDIRQEVPFKFVKKLKRKRSKFSVIITKG